jgi:K(+)-stimulated pyrophosphate-energized sodium pump
MGPIIISIACGVLGLLVAALMAWYVLKQDKGSKKVQEISEAIREGATAFLGKEYRILAIFIVLVAVVLRLVPALGWLVSLAFVFGAVCLD